MEIQQSALPATQQPDVSVPTTGLPHPSLVTYLGLIIAALAMISIAHYLQPQPDWPGLLVNLGSSLISAVVLLILIDRRLRRSEISALLSMPSRVGLLIALTMVPRKRSMYKFNLLQLDALDPLTRTKVVSKSLDELAQQDGSFVLLGPPGTGKTTLLQMLCALRAREHQADYHRAVPILFAARRWLPDRTLDRAILEYVRGFYPVTDTRLAKCFAKDPIIMMIDGADEIFRVGKPDRLRTEVERLRRLYPRITWIVGSRPDHPTPVADVPTINIEPLSSKEIQEVFRRLEPAFVAARPATSGE